MKKLFIGILPAVFGLCSVAAFAQTPPPPAKPTQPTQTPAAQPAQPVVAPCPQIQLQGPNRPLKDGDPVTFAVNIGGGDPNVQPIYSWSISSGTIVRGQGTRNIAVDSTGAGNDRQIIADLLIGGYSFECTNRATAIVAIAAPAKKVDEFGDLPEKDEAGKLTSIINYLAQAPDRIYLIGYAGKTNERGYAVDALRRMKAFLAKGGAPAERVIAIDGGFKEQPSYEIWVVPIGADAPRPAPTVDRKDVIYPKPTPRTKKPAANF